MFKISRTNSIIFWDAVKKGAFWGLFLGIILNIIIAKFLDLPSNNPEVTDPTTVVIYGILWGIIGAALGCTVALILEGIIGTIKFLNWLFIFLGGSLLTINAVKHTLKLKVIVKI